MQTLNRLQQHLIKPAHAYTLIGRYQIGKTALLRRFQQAASVDTIGIYVPLRQLPLTSETLWLNSLAEIAIETVRAQGYDPVTLELMEDDSVRRWFVEGCLPSLYRAIHTRRKLVLLLDDAEQLLLAIQAGQLPDDTFAYLDGLIGEQLGIVVTLHQDYEDQLARFAPLVNPDLVERLMNLTLEDIRQQMPDRDASLIQNIYDATGGEPGLVEAFSQRLASADDAPAFEQTMALVYDQVQDRFQTIWHARTRDERLVLTAMISLHYDDPLRDIDTGRIEQWLVETDYPLDRTTINVAIRGLEYQELVKGSSNDLRIAAGLLRKWLMQNARLDGVASPAESGDGLGLTSNRLWLVVLVALVILLGVVSVLLIGQLDGGDSATVETVPTVTLIPDSSP